MSKKNIEMQVLGTDGNYESIYPVPAGHKESHISGNDRITPADIGAQEAITGTEGQTVVIGSNGKPTVANGVGAVVEQHHNLPQKFWRGTQAEYDAIQNKDDNTMYIITDASGEPIQSGDMLKSVYDTKNRNTDIFKYVDEHATNIPVTDKPADNVNIWIDPTEEGDGGGVDIPAQDTEPATGNYWLDTSAEGGTYYTAGEVDELLQNKAGLDENGKVPESQLPSLGFKPQIIVTAPTGSTVIATLGSKTYTATESAGTWTFDVDEYGVYTVTATLDSDTASAEVEVSIVQRYTIELAYAKIYGVEWDGTSTTVWSRTDDSASFVNPTPYVAGASSYGSPFDNLYPWNGMVRVTDNTAGELVAIPKFWYKWTRSGDSMKLQIADGAVDGFSVSPAHMDRGDGKGERDIIYVGRYHCDSSYKSVTGNSPVGSITRATARSNIHNLGSTYWQFDYATLWTIWMLYLVEYGDWDSQKMIGYGCGDGDSSGTKVVGLSDSMPYHTGTMQSSRSTYGVGCQYRYIEDLWGNVYNFCDGIYFNGATIYGILNPANFSDTSNGTIIGTRPTSGGVINAYNIPTASGFEWALYPSAVSSSESGYITDYCYYEYYGSSGVVLICGSYYSQRQTHGLFFLSGDQVATATNPHMGCRLMKLP